MTGNRSLKSSSLDKWLKFIEMPWSADLRFSVSEEMLEAILKEAVGNKIKIASVQCHQDYIGISFSAMITTITVELAVESIHISKNECVITIKDVKGNISAFRSLINLFDIPLKIKKDGIIEIDLSDKVRDYLSSLHWRIVDLMEKTKIDVIFVPRKCIVCLTFPDS